MTKFRGRAEKMGSGAPLHEEINRAILDFKGRRNLRAGEASFAEWPLPQIQLGGKAVASYRTPKLPGRSVRTGELRRGASYFEGRLKGSGAGVPKMRRKVMSWAR